MVVISKIAKLIRGLGGMVFISLAFLSCESEVVAPENFVIEGFLFAGEPVIDVTVKNTLTLEETGVAAEVISNASVKLVKSEVEYPLSFDETLQKYTSNSNDLIVNSGDRFQIEVNYNGREAKAQTVVPVPPLNVSLSDSILIIPTIPLSFQTADIIRDLFFEERLLLTWDNPLEESFFVTIENREPVLDTLLPSAVPQDAVDFLGSFRFISEPSTTSSFEIIGVALETYGTHVAKVYRLNEEYENLFDNLTQDSRDLNEPPSNIENALGIFTAFAADSVFFEVKRE